MHTPTAFEQQILEYTNRARMFPDAEFDALIADAATNTGVQGNITSALRYFGVDPEALRAQFAALEAAPPLAWNGALATAAEGHSEQMILYDIQSHQVPGELSIGDRILAAGYSFTSAAENVFAYTQDPLHGHAGFFIDWGYDDADWAGSSLLPDWQNIGDGIQDAAGHRVAIMDPEFTEVGMGAIDDSADDAIDQVGPYVLTQNFGTRADYTPQLLGVVIDDADGDLFYDIGEGLGGLEIVAEGDTGVFVTTSWASGGYQMALPDGAYTVTVSGTPLAGQISFSVTISGANVKRDAFAADAVQPGPPTGGAGDDMLVGTAGDDSLSGAQGADTLQGAAGDDILNGDVLPIFRVPEEAGQIYRLYQATLDRAPDAAGYQIWTERLFETEWTLGQIADGFLLSPEFQNIYGALPDADFVTLLYRNVLDREPDPAGQQGWLDLLAAGGTRAQVVLGFSESTEFRIDTAGAAAAAAEAASAPAWQDDVFRLYQATLDRAPDLAGFLGWAENLAGGQAYLDVVQGFVGSAEFEVRYGALTDADFVALLYQNVLDREPDPAGQQGWLDLLAAGGTRIDIVRGFAQSDEFRAATAADLEAWIRAQGTQDVLEGGAGTNMLSGGMLCDRFVFTPREGDSHYLLDLEPWDMLDFEAFGYGLPEELRVNLTQIGEDLVFADRGVTITFHDSTVADITDAMLLL